MNSQKLFNTNTNTNVNTLLKKKNKSPKSKSIRPRTKSLTLTRRTPNRTLKRRKTMNKSLSLSLSETNENNTIPTNRENNLEIRRHFFKKLRLTEKNHFNYIYTLLQIISIFQDKITKICYEKNIEIGGNKYKVVPHHNNKFIVFGGALFFMIYYEAKKMDLLKDISIDLINEFLGYYTTDIDVIFDFELYELNENNDVTNVLDFYELDEETFLKIVPEINALLKEGYMNIYNDLFKNHKSLLGKIKLILNAKSKKYQKTLKNSNKSNNSTNILDISFKDLEEQIKDDAELLRVNIETCANKFYCDHIFDILNFHNFKNKNIKGNLVSFSSFKNEFLCENLFLVARENVDRIVQEISGTTQEINEQLIQKVASLGSIKYRQGYLRVKLCFEILKNLDESSELFKVFNLLPGYIISELKILKGRLRKLPINKLFNVNDIEMLIKETYFTAEAKTQKLFLKPAKKEHVLLAYEKLLEFWNILNDYVSKL